jgi:hypothetical protein
MLTVNDNVARDTKTKTGHGPKTETIASVCSTNMLSFRTSWSGIIF